jgi:hypothetical protein
VTDVLITLTQAALKRIQQHSSSRHLLLIGLGTRQDKER